VYTRFVGKYVIGRRTRSGSIKYIRVYSDQDYWPSRSSRVRLFVRMNAEISEIIRASMLG